MEDWMSFAAWYSFKKNLANYEVFIETSYKKPSFKWMNVFSCFIKKPSEKDKVFPATVMAVRDFEDSWDVFSCKTDFQSCFVDYSEGFGNFVVDKWINNRNVPFYNALKIFATNLTTINEIAILKMWEKCETLYRHAGA